MPERPKSMTPVRACQVATQLIHRLETHALLPNQGEAVFTIGREELDALHVLRNTVASAVCGFKVRAADESLADGTLHIPKK